MGRRIIPARAGFTSGSRSVTRWRQDHPRSCGVYAPPREECRGGQGSSPLVRGLPDLLPDRPVEAGIIPARAGFTAQYETIRPSCSDHPRSCGVYPRTETPVWSAEGSSPLVRGLQSNFRAAEIGSGIIPARAGFTDATAHGSALRPDHPRSCGVYHFEDAVAGLRGGSSPLVRGLPRATLFGGPMDRIIPARAGFTESHAHLVIAARDHPRSCGVYRRTVP